MENIPKDKILAVVKEGPTIPTRIVKRVGGDTMLIGAILSTLVHQGEVQISSLKIGGSPLYYIKDHEGKLEEYIDHLNDKDQKTVALLKEKHVLIDSVQNPLIRVSLRAIKDFARPFECDVNGNKELCWRYFTYDPEQATKQAQQGMVLVQEKELVEIEKNDVTNSADAHAVIRTTNHTETPIVENETMPIVQTAPTNSEQIIADREPQTPVEQYAAQKESTGRKNIKTDFFERIHDFITFRNLDIISKEKIKKTEYALVLKNHANNEYIYCVAKDKKTINEGDLSTAFVFAHNKKMPCMFIMTGKLTKNAENMSAKEFKDMKIAEI